jgi:hypothetical protein
VDTSQNAVQHILDVSAIVAALFGALGSLYAASTLYPSGLKQFTAAVTAGLAGAVTSGVALGIPALDAAYFHFSGITSVVVGLAIGTAYGFAFFLKVAAPSLEELDDPDVMTLPLGHRPKQPADIAAWVWSRICWGGGLGWAWLAFSLAPQKDQTRLYIATIMIIGGTVGFLVSYITGRRPEQRPFYFSFSPVPTVIGVTATLLSGLLFVGLAIAAFSSGKGIFDIRIPSGLNVPLEVLVPVPAVIVALSIVPFARWRIEQLTDKGFGRIGIVLILLAFLMQLVQPVSSLLHIGTS